MKIKLLRIIGIHESVSPMYRKLVIFLGFGAVIFSSLLFLAPDLFAAQKAAARVEYREFPILGSRNLIWIVAQLHLLFGSFVLGVPIFAVIAEFVGIRTKDPKYDKLAHEFSKLLSLSFSTTAVLGGFLLLSLISFYPVFFDYLTDIFWPSYMLYAGLFFGEIICLYVYYYAWDVMEDRKYMHLCIGILLNVFGTVIMFVTNAWGQYMASPVILPPELVGWERAWAAANNFTWWPMNIHRLIANVSFGGYIVGAYAATQFLNSKSDEERAHYDWMGYIGILIGVGGMIPLPFAGYWLALEFYQYSQQMGITLMGGFLSWLFIIQAVMISIIFIATNYYFWLGIINRTKDGEKYRWYINFMLIGLAICALVWITPHSVVASLEEAREMGGTHHPLLGVLGVMSAKMTAVNVMILITFISFILYLRANKEEVVKWAKAGRMVQIVLCAIAFLYVIWLGIYGYFVPTVVRIGFSVNQVAAVIGSIFFVSIMTILILRGARSTGDIRWGNMPPRSQYVLILLAVTIVLLMAMMGYAREAVRTYWHIFGVLKDTSPHAFSPSLGQASKIIAAITLIFFSCIGFIFWLCSLGAKKGGEH